MAKAKPNAGQSNEGHGTKSAAIRELLTQTPKMPVREVAKTLRVSAGHVYVAKHRISRLIKKELERLEQASG